jgi:peptidoglycan-N-acetylglucosamine deacetylase
MRIFRLPLFFRLLYPGAYFRMNPREKIVYLTIDDGPCINSTPEILSILKEEGVVAGFFCNGEAFESNAGLAREIRDSGNLIANHGYRHAKGWKTGFNTYVNLVDKGAEITGSDLFRPPYGSLTPLQFRSLDKKYKIIFWDLILYDFDRGFSDSNILRILRRKIRPGSIIVVHDNEKSLRPGILREIIKTIRDAGYKFGDLASVL